MLQKLVSQTKQKNKKAISSNKNDRKLLFCLRIRFGMIPYDSMIQ